MYLAPTVQHDIDPNLIPTRGGEKCKFGKHGQVDSGVPRQFDPVRDDLSGYSVYTKTMPDRFRITYNFARNGNTSANILAGRFLTIFSLSWWPTPHFNVCERVSRHFKLFLSLSENAFLSKFLQQRFVNENDYFS